MILNPDNCHYMCLGKDAVNDILKFGNEELKSSKIETVLGIEIGQKSTFNCHIITLCSKTAKKLIALQRWLILLMKKREIYHFMRLLNLNLATVTLYGCSARGDQVI